MKIKKTLLIPLLFFAGLLCGLGIATLMENKGDSGNTPDMTNNIADRWKDEKLELASRIASQRSQIADLQVELEKAREFSMDSSPGREPETTEEGRRARVQEMFAERMGQRLDSRIDKMATAYGLNEAQRVALKEAYLKRTENQRARRNGEAVERFDMDAALSAVMNEEQFAAYLEETQQDIYNRAELMAATQTVRLSQLINLDPDVEAMVYDTMNLTSQEMMIAHQEGEEFNYLDIMDERLGSFLTEEQMEVVQDNMRDIMGGGGGRGPGGGQGGGRPPGP